MARVAIPTSAESEGRAVWTLRPEMVGTFDDMILAVLQVEQRTRVMTDR
jgi:hypothetical protein